MTETTTPEQAKETYERVVRDEPHYNWPTWVIVISNSLACGGWIGGTSYPAWVKGAYDLIKAENKISFSDSN